MSELNHLNQIANLPLEVRSRLFERLKLKKEQENILPSTISPRSRDGQTLLPSFAQQGLWFLEQLVPGSSSYTIPMAVQLEGVLQCSVLKLCLAEVIRRHEVLRTTFAEHDGQLVQVIASSLVIVLPVIDLQGLSHDHQQAEIHRLTNQEFSLPFHLSRGPLLRVTLLRQAAQKHILLLTMHHIISDGWSVNVLVHELTTLYAAFTAQQPSPLPELAIQYADFALWQRQRLQGEVLEQQLSYWREQLQDLPVLQLPTDHPRPQVEQFRGTHIPFQLSTTLSQQVQQFSRQEGVTLYMTLLAAFQVLLWRYSGQEDLAVGMPVANRMHKEVEGLIGFFVNTLVLRTQLSGNLSVQSLVQHVRKKMLEAYAHQDIPFEYLVEQLQPERDISRNPLFQVVLMLMNTPQPQVKAAGLTLTPLPSEIITSHFDLSLLLTESTEGLTGRWEYNTDLFDAETIKRMHTHWQRILEAMVVTSEQRLAQLPLLSANEKKQMLFDWNATQVDYAQPHNLPLLLEKQAERTPDTIAVAFEKQMLTYRELDQRANQLAHLVQQRGAGADVLVGICMNHSLEMVIGVLAILKAGAAYLPLDPSYPQERLALLLREAQPVVLLTQLVWQELVQDLSTDVIYVNAQDEPSKEYSSCPPPRNIEPNHLAYVIYTSGSTGTPKGVMITHQGLFNYLSWATQAYNVTSGYGSPVHSPLSFDLTVTSLFPSLLVGQTVYLLSSQQDLEALLIALRSGLHFGLVKLTPAHLFLLNKSLTPLEASDSTRALVIGGEELRGEHLKFWQQHAPGVRLINEYGPTETVVGCCVYEAAVDEVFSNAVPIGRPIANTSLFVFDAYWQPVPIGVVGELYIGGKGIARGYLGHPELTAERFVPHPFATQAGERLYRTGDLARYRADGTLEFLGRKDTQVKLRGYRIELGEIEAVLYEQPGVQNAVVVVCEDMAEDKRLVAYVTLDPTGKNRVRSLHEALQEKLPAYMLPSSIMELEALPLTPNGKVDRRALPAPSAMEGSSKETYVAPRTPIEELLAGIWADVLGIERIGIHDHFFALGGYSLLAIQAILRMQETLNIKLPLSSLFANPTITEMVNAIQKAQQEQLEYIVSPLQPFTHKGISPLPPSQQGIWLQEKLAPGNPFYNTPVAVRIEGALNFSALVKSLNEIVQRHEVLRTTFIEIDGQPMQSIQEQATIVVPLVDLQGKNEEASRREMQRLIQEEACQLFDLQCGPMLRAILLRIEVQKHVLLLNMHHIVTDGWSMSILAQELNVLYRAFVKQQPSPLPRLSIQYADFALWQQEWLQGEILEQQSSYWRERLAGASPLDLPTDYPRPKKMQLTHSAQLPFQLSAEVSKGLTRLSRQIGVTLFMTLLATFQLLLARYSGQEDIIVGTPIANRPHTELESLIGFFVNTIVLRTKVNNRQTIRELLQQVREVTLGAYTHQDLPFSYLVEQLQPERDLSHNPLFQIVFGLHTTPVKVEAVDDLTITVLPTTTGSITFDLGLAFTESIEGLKGVWEYSTALFAEATIKRMHDHFQLLLEVMLENQEQRLLDLPALPLAEQQILLHEWNTTIREELPELCFQQLFEKQVKVTPDSIAVVLEHDHLTYQALNERANQLAHYLQRCGVGPEVTVGLCLECSLEAIVALLGIFKAGGAYVPLDPRYPEQRLDYLLQDAAVGILLTQQELLDNLPVYPWRLICLDNERAEIAKMPPGTPVCNVEVANLAYMIYTSGSSGKPKGVQVTHRGLHNLLFSLVDTFHVDGTSRVFQFASLSFDASILELVMALLSGATFCLNSLGRGLLGSDLVQLLRKQAVTHLALTPSALATFPTEALPDLEMLTVGGEVCSADLVARWAPGRRFFNSYGPTETTVWVSVAACATDTEKPLIGRPLANIEFYLLDGHLLTVPIGTPGELYIGSVGMARGYWQHADLTAEHFIPHPFSTIPGSRLYKTGDIVRYHSDGALEFLGRFDQQVKIRGYRIELGEIEAALSQHPGVRTCAANIFTDALGNRRLVGYIVPNEDHDLMSNALRHYLSQQLPQHMVPVRFVFLDALPLTASNKVDREMLPAPDEESVPLQPESLAPRTATEAILSAIWKRVLGIEVGVYDNFFTLGGDSILCVQVVAQAAQMGLSMTPNNLFQYQTIAELATIISPLTSNKWNQEMVIGPVPFTPIQHWFFEQRFLVPHEFVETVFLRIEKRLEPVLLAQALYALQLHHDALRLYFTFSEGSWQQVNQEMQESHAFMHIDLSSIHPEYLETAIKHTTTQVQTSLDLQNGPLLRLCLLDAGPQQPQHLLCVVHHLLVDVISLHILIEDLETAYTQLAQGQEVSLPAKTSSYQRWAQFLREYAYSDQINREVSYWSNNSHHTIQPIPVDKIEKTTNAAREQHLLNLLGEEETRALLHDIPLTHAIQINEVVLAALALTLSRWTGQYRTLLDLKGHGREDLSSEIDVSRTIGWFTSLFPVYLELSAGMSLGAVLAAIKEQIHSVPHRGIGYGIVRYIREDKLFQEIPQAEINFNYLGQFDQIFTSSNLFTSILDSIDVVDNPQETQAYRLTITALVKQKKLHVYWTYKDQDYHQSTITRLAEECLATIRDLIHYCQTTQISSYTPADFPDIAISQVELDELLTLLDATKE